MSTFFTNSPICETMDGSIQIRLFLNRFHKSELWFCEMDFKLLDRLFTSVYFLHFFLWKPLFCAASIYLRRPEGQRAIISMHATT